jgi:hypothetical protein
MVYTSTMKPVMNEQVVVAYLCGYPGGAKLARRYTMNHSRFTPKTSLRFVTIEIATVAVSVVMVTVMIHDRGRGG